MFSTPAQTAIRAVLPAAIEKFSGCLKVVDFAWLTHPPFPATFVPILEYRLRARSVSLSLQTVKLPNFPAAAHPPAQTPLNYC